MALDFQLVSVDLTNGASEKKDEKLTLVTRLVQLANGQFSEDGSLQLRNGTSVLCSGSLIGGGAVAGADMLAAYGEELLQSYRDALYSYSPSTGKLALRGRAPHVSLRKRQVIRNTSTQTNADGAVDTTNGWTAHAWEDSRGGVRYSIEDSATGAAIVYDTSVSATGQMPRVLLAASTLAIIYVEGANLKVAYVDRQRPADALTFATIASNVHGTAKAMDALVLSGDDIYCAWQNTTPALSRVVYSIGSGAGTAVNVAVANNLSGIALSRTTDGKVQVWHSQATVGMRALVDSVSGTAITNTVAPTTTDSGTGAASASQLTATESTTANTAIAYYVTATGAPTAVIRTSSITSGGSATGAAEVLLHCQLAARAFAYGSKVYLPVVFDGAAQASVFVLEMATRSVVARALPLSGARTTATFVRLGSVSSPSATSVSLPVLEQGRFEAQSTQVTTTIGVSRLTLAMDRSEPLPPVVFADSLFLPGACPMAYDGVSAVEYGFSVYPESVSPASAGAGSTPAGTRYFAAVYEWTDAKGRRHQSPPSLSASYTNAGATAVTVTLQTLSLTDKYDNGGLSLKPVARTNANIAVYVTEAGGTTFYRSGSVANNPLTATVTYSHNITDAALIANEILYDATNSGTFDAFAPPSCRAAWVHQDQLFVGGCEDERAVFYSRPLSDGAGLSFSPLRRLRVPEDRGGVVAGSSMDSRLAVLTEVAPGFFDGEAPNAAGQGAGYSDWREAQEAVGCSEPRSVIYAAGGLWFQASAGLHVLGGDGSVSFVGADVADSNTGAITAAVLVPSQKQIRWTQTTGVTLVFDYLWKQWGTATANIFRAAGATLFDGEFVLVGGDGVTYVEDDSVRTDDGTGYNLFAVTGWLRMGAVQGFQRVRRALLLGKAAASVNLSLYTSLNYAPAGQNAEIEQVDFAAADPLQINHHLSVQKGAAMQFEITANTSAAFSLSNLTLEVGLKRGGFKTAST